MEDERIVAMDLRAELEALGYHVVGTAGSCDEALMKAAKGAPDLVLMDIRIRGDVDGIQTAELLRARDRLPVVYLTASADQGTLRRALETEPCGFLAKPYSRRNLHTTIEIALRRRDAELASREAQDVERRRFQERSDELLALSERLGVEAHTDALTQLHNRRYLDVMMKEQLRLAEQERLAIGLILCDLDRFKQLNDSHGHLVGDKVLSQLGAYLRASLRGGDVACRYGGEEIIIIAPSASLFDTFALAERLRVGIESLRLEVEGREISFTASFGVSAFPEHGMGPEQLIRAADAALYTAKSAGRNCVVAAVV